MLSILNRKSETHNSCEDTVWVEENEQYVVGGVFDGCSTGFSSHWASQTYAYLFKKQLFRHKEYPTALLSDITLHSVVAEMREMARNLNLIDMNFLSTAILFVYSKKTRTLHMRTFGDCVYYIDDIEHEVEQNNTPEYIGYLINKNWMELKQYMVRYSQLVYTNVSRFVICSDGIKQVKASQFTDDNIDPMSSLLAPPTGPLYLTLKWNILKHNKFTLNDDLSIISYATT